MDVEEYYEKKRLRKIKFAEEEQQQTKLGEQKMKSGALKELEEEYAWSMHNE